MRRTETVLVISGDVFEKLPEKEQKDFYHYKRYQNMSNDWDGDNVFWGAEDLCSFSGVKQVGDIDFLDVYTNVYKSWDDGTDLKYFDDIASNINVKGFHVKRKQRLGGWYKENIYDSDTGSNKKTYLT